MINYILFIILGFLPSLVWLIFYLRRDVHPEPKEMVIKIFIYGMGVTIFAAFIELISCNYLEGLSLSSFLKVALQFFIAIALVEEIMKYLVVHFGVLRNPEFDEPIDAMIYMIIAGLGFAAIENILVLFPITPPVVLGKTLLTSLGRFVSATLLHALASANIGYFLALSFFNTKNRLRLILFGIITSTLLHGIYNFGINTEGRFRVLIPFLVLVFLCFLARYQFREIKKLKSVCKIT
jgi:RsiW-degrading membrane proteinase PrsW (M82 family)